MKKAIISCSVFYKELLDLIGDQEEITIEFLPQGLHDIPDCSKMKGKIQTKIDQLEEEEDYDYIILAYGFCSGGVEGLQAEKANLVIPIVHDCIPLLLGNKNAKGNLENSRTFYLSRGWIDCSGDTYKHYLAMTEQMEQWIDRFKEYQQEDEDAMVEWPDLDQYNTTRSYDQDTAEYISYQCLKSYEMITLIDNDNLAPIHYQYAQEMHGFIDQILAENNEQGLGYQEVEGSLEFLRELIYFEQLDEAEREELFLITPPQQPLQLEEHII
ncbi:DUF1638 domain-containing protein [Natroniella sulfidigena]|uniref:DUF1638 domain-containing protein n=1 Tax=Natroniella sulfidigena TaxID=723921 RepID=UPI00200AB8F9|nr:DUF1638 domain-containing protein [Natroniella sulfidigena]MCK8817844.1 DUF1638 domain-containing protein [Natroniella sulfidigena]